VRVVGLLCFEWALTRILMVLSCLQPGFSALLGSIDDCLVDDKPT
jgi:hypothetical protein